MIWLNIWNTWVISDFDRTFTKATTPTVFDIFSKCPHVPRELNLAQSKNYRHFRPIETNPWLAPEERAKHMRDWHNAAMEAFHIYLTEDIFQETLAYAQEVIEIRDGMIPFTNRLAENGIPLAFSSAWISDIIRAVLNYHNVPHVWVQWNHLEFDTHWEFVGVKTPVYIWQKKWEFLPQDIMTHFSGRTDIILLWDDPDDILMWPQDRTLHKVWFLVSEQKEKEGWEELIRNKFEHVVESDDGDDWFLRQIEFR